MNNVPIGINTTEQLGGEVHVVEVIDNLIPVGLLGGSIGKRKSGYTCQSRGGRKLIYPVDREMVNKENAVSVEMQYPEGRRIITSISFWSISRPAVSSL